ncbi:unnamed protein product, partial [Polarella glacialis]
MSSVQGHSHGLKLTERSAFSHVDFGEDLDTLCSLEEDPSEILAASGKFSRSITSVTAKRKQQAAARTSKYFQNFNQAAAKSSWADLSQESEAELTFQQSPSALAEGLAEAGMAGNLLWDPIGSAPAAVELNQVQAKLQSLLQQAVIKPGAKASKDIYMDSTTKEFERWSHSTTATDFDLDECPSPDPWEEESGKYHQRGSFQSNRQSFQSRSFDASNA